MDQTHLPRHSEHGDYRNVLITVCHDSAYFIDLELVLDLSVQVRSSTTSLAQTCQALSARRRWMVSGTPLHSSIDDLNGELLFLGALLVASVRILQLC